MDREKSLCLSAVIFVDQTTRNLDGDRNQPPQNRKIPQSQEGRNICRIRGYLNQAFFVKFGSFSVFSSILASLLK